MTRPTYLYTFGLVVQGIAYLVAGKLESMPVVCEAGIASLGAASVMFFAERWVKSTTANKG